MKNRRLDPEGNFYAGSDRLKPTGHFFYLEATIHEVIKTNLTINGQAVLAVDSSQ